MNFSYESESGVLLENPSEEDIDVLLSQIDGVSISYASLTATDGSYVQVGGGPNVFTVEVRVMEQRGVFRHLKATLPSEKADQHCLMIGGSSVYVRENQLLNLASVQQIFRSFRHGIKRCSCVIWQDITSMFQE